jgi:serine/threonine protein phosphatase PrpC
MKFNIGGFTHKGTAKFVMNEDQILINRTKVDEGELFLNDQDFCYCFVSDGVGGIQGGVFASSFLLLMLRDIAEDKYGEINQKLYTINDELIRQASVSSSLTGCACTLSGIIASKNFVEFYHVGDSEIWLLRDDMLIKITKDEVLEQDDTQSPITNYFGGKESKLKINTDWNKPEILANDIFLICTDGLFKSLDVKLVKPILASDKSVEEKVLKLKENCLAMGADDNVSAVVVQCLNDVEMNE